MTINLRKNVPNIIKIFVLIVMIFSLTLINMNNKKEESIQSSSQGLSNKKIGWGIKRNDNHEQPDLGKNNKEILEKNNGIAMGNNVDKYIYLTFDEGYGQAPNQTYNQTPDGAPSVPYTPGQNTDNNPYS